MEEQGYEKDGETSGVINNTYSELGRLEKQEAQADGKENEFEYNNIGQIVRAVDDSGMRTYEYDERGRVTKETNGSEVKEYSYDENDNRTSLTVKRGGTVVQQEEYEYNRLNQLTQVKDGSGSVIGKYDYTYYFDGNILSENDKLYEYDKQGRLVKEGNAENVQEYTSYSYDRFGNRESMEYVTAITGNERSATYEYDKNNRLVEETRQGLMWASEIAPESAVSYIYYEYDSMGNLVSKRGAESDLGSGEDHVGLNVLKTSPNNTLVEMYDYDGFNRLRKVRKGGTTAQYTYNAEGIRTAKTVNGERTSFILDGANVIGEVNTNRTTSEGRVVSS